MGTGERVDRYIRKPVPTWLFRFLLLCITVSAAVSLPTGTRAILGRGNELAEELFEVLLEDEVATGVTDSDGRFLQINTPLACLFSGKEEPCEYENVLGSNLCGFVSNEDSNRLSKVINEASAGHDPVDTVLECSLLHGGETIPVRIHIMSQELVDRLYVVVIEKR